MEQNLSRLHGESETLSIFCTGHPVVFLNCNTIIHSFFQSNTTNTQKEKDNEKIFTTEHPAAYLHNTFPDTIVRYLILIISYNGIPKNTKIVITRY
jgi:hypothetical protein